jgi:hypothetical protein
MAQISIAQATFVYKVTSRTIYNWIAEDSIECHNGLYDFDKLQEAFDKRRKPKPRNKYLRI